MVKDLQVASRYAQALFDISRLTHEDEVVEAELESISEALKKSPEIEKFLLNPQLKVDEKRKFLQRIYQERRHEIYGTLLNFFTVLFDKNRFGLIHEIAVAFKRIADEAQGQGVAQIMTATVLSPMHEGQIVSRMEKIAGYKITVKKDIDARLIGGVVVKVKNKVWDGSIKHTLDLMKKELTKIRTI